MATSAATQEVLDKLALRKLPAPQKAEETNGVVHCSWKDGAVSLTRGPDGCTWNINGELGRSNSLAEAQDALAPALAKAEKAAEPETTAGGFRR